MRINPFRSRRRKPTLGQRVVAASAGAQGARGRFEHAFGNLTAAATAAHDAETRRGLKEPEQR